MTVHVGVLENGAPVLKGIDQIFLGKQDGFEEQNEAFAGAFMVHAPPPAPQIVSFILSLSHFNQGTGPVPTLRGTWDITGDPDTITTQATRPDGTRESLRTFPSVWTNRANIAVGLPPNILGRTSVLLSASRNDLVAHALAYFELRLAPSVLSLVDGGFRQDPLPTGGSIYKHRIDWQLGTAVWPAPGDPGYSTTLVVTSGPGSLGTSDPLRATNISDGRGHTNLTSGVANRGQVTTVRLTATNTAGSVHQDLTLQW